MKATIQEIEDVTVLAIEHDGKLYVGICSIIAPRDARDIDTQAVDELSDAGELD